MGEEMATTLLDTRIEVLEDKVLDLAKGMNSMVMDLNSMVMKLLETTESLRENMEKFLGNKRTGKQVVKEKTRDVEKQPTDSNDQKNDSPSGPNMKGPGVLIIEEMKIPAVKYVYSRRSKGVPVGRGDASSLVEEYQKGSKNMESTNKIVSINETADESEGEDHDPVTKMQIDDTVMEGISVPDFGGVQEKGEFSTDEMLAIEGKQNIEENSMDLIKMKEKRDLRRGVLPKFAGIDLIGWAFKAEPYSELTIGSPINHREIIFSCTEDSAHPWFQGTKIRVGENAEHPWFQWVKKKKAPDKATDPCKGIADWKPWWRNSGLQSEGLQTKKIEWAWAKLPCIGLVFKGPKEKYWSNPNMVGLNAKNSVYKGINSWAMERARSIKKHSDQGYASPIIRRGADREWKNEQGVSRLMFMHESKAGTSIRLSQLQVHKEIGKNKGQGKGFNEADSEQPIRKRKETRKAESRFEMAEDCKLKLINQVLNRVTGKLQLNNLRSSGYALLEWEDKDGSHSYISKSLSNELCPLILKKGIVELRLGYGYQVTVSGRSDELKIEIGTCVFFIVTSSASFGIDHELTVVLYLLIVSSIDILVCLPTTLFASNFFEDQDVLGVEHNKSQSLAAIDFYKTSTIWGTYDSVTSKDLSGNFIFTDTQVGDRTLDLDSKFQEFNNAVNNATISRVGTEEHPLDSLHFRNLFCDLEFEIIVFDVGWKDAEFADKEVSRLSLEDKADFQEGGIVRCLVPWAFKRSRECIVMGLNTLGRSYYLVKKIILEEMTWERGKGNILGGKWLELDIHVYWLLLKDY